MRLTRLEVFGFKSFAQKVQIPFGLGITAVVGPNGCGKSNIVEAIRWVLGEQRAGVFRSHRMEEVIFAGTRQRKPLGMADVSLTIDNSNGDLPIEFSEVTITRRLFRSGDSDYLLNKVPCRLLDIQNLLMDTGLGPGAYSVMEQGMVDEIISERTENRRRILEEAAGITKYKARRRSTWSKLESTQADLVRLEDIIAEVQRQVDYLSRQVGRARRYQDLKQQLDGQELLLGRFRFFALQDQLRPLQDEFTRLTSLAESGYTQFTAREAELEKRRLAVTEVERGLQEIGLELGRCIEQIHEQDRRLVATRASLEAAAQFSTRATAEQEEYGGQLAAARQQRQDAIQDLAAARQEQESTVRLLQESEQQAAQTERRGQVQEAELETSQRQRLDLLRQHSEGSRVLERLRTEHEGLLEHRRQVAAEALAATAEGDRSQAQMHQAAATAEQLADRRRRLQVQHQQVQDRAAAVEAQHRRLEERRGELGRSLAAEQARLQVLERVRAQYEGYSSGVRRLMLDSPYQHLFAGVLGDLLEVDPTYYRAAEAALGEAMQALVADDEQGVLDALRFLADSSGRAGVFPLSWQTPWTEPAAVLPSFPGLLGPLAAHVRVESRLAPLVGRLLHNTFLVEDLGPALEMSGQYLDQRVRFVTPAGEAVDLGGRVVGGQTSAEDHHVLGRGQELRQLHRLIAGEKAHLAGLQAEYQGVEFRRAILARRLAVLAPALEELKSQEQEQGHLRARAQAEVQRLQARLDQLGREEAHSLGRLQELEDAIRDRETHLRGREEAAGELETRIHQQEESLRQTQAQRREHTEQLAARRVEQARIAEKAASLQRDAERLERIEQGLEHNLQRLAQEVAKNAGERQHLSSQEEQLTAELREQHQAREGLETERDRRQQHWQEAVVHARESEEAISQLQRELGAQRERRHQLELEIAELHSQTDHIRERLQEGQQCDVEAMGRLAVEDFDPEATQRRIDELRQSLLRLGSVYLGVLEEHQQQKERLDFLVRQRDDLMAAAEDLKHTLQLIDRTARRMFLETFEEIRQKFRETFIRFFPGGEADLLLQPEADPLESAIDIIARPRGKRLQSIELLSGGERALTAISLLFAIYQVKPSPFCILDEVDAPLDDANVESFARVLKEFAHDTQFIMVTHNKISMSAADTLHGVTMPEEGVSQLVSVQIGDESLEEAAG